jgi:hypothetical protein
VGTSVAFLGSGSNGQNGIYLGSTAGGPVSRLYDTSTLMPFTGGIFGDYLHFNISGTSVAFVGRQPFPITPATITGVYMGTVSGGPVTRVVDTSTTFPNGVSVNNFFFVSTNGSKVAFGAASNSGGYNGIFSASADGSNLTMIADTNTVIPGGVGNFTSFDRPVMNSSVVAFTASGPSGYKGLFSAPVGGGPLTKIVATGDVLDGRVVASSTTPNTPNGVAIGTQGIDGSKFAFTVNFTDGSEAVYTFTPVPEPTGLLPFSVAVPFGAFAARRWLFRGF